MKAIAILATIVLPLSCKAPPSAVGARGPEVATVERDPNAIVSLALGHERACALRTDQRVVCWGRSQMMPAGKKKPPREPTFVEGVQDIVQITGEDGSWCGLQKNGGVLCWSGTTDAKPVGISAAVEISKSWCARRSDGTVLCFPFDLDAPKPPKAVAGIPPARALCRNCECAIDTDRTATCWGSSFLASFSDGLPADLARAPWKVPGLSGALEMDSSYFFGSCARVGGGVRCWGGEWRCSSTSTREACWEPKTVVGITTATQIAVTEYHACARLLDGTVSCWGSNSSGQRGLPIDPEGGEPEAPTVVPELHDVVQVAVGGGEPCGGCGSTCVIDKGGAVSCFGELGGKKSKPTRVALTPKN